MTRVELDFAPGFRVVAGNARSEAAEMTLAPGETVGGAWNRHEESDQWLLVVDGEGEAVVEGARSELAPGVLLLIERGEAHEIRNTGGRPMKTVNLYVPPEYEHG